MATVMSLGKKIGKAAVVSLNAPGFIGNRMLAGYTYQANMLLLEGALPSQVDNALESFGMSMGPFRMMDLVGLDLGWRARKLANLETPLVNKISAELCERDRFGQKILKDFITILRDQELQILLQKMKKFIKRFLKKIIFKEGKYLIRK